MELVPEKQVWADDHLDKVTDCNVRGPITSYVVLDDGMVRFTVTSEDGHHTATFDAMPPETQEEIDAREAERARIEQEAADAAQAERERLEAELAEQKAAEDAAELAELEAHIQAEVSTRLEALVPDIVAQVKAELTA